MSDNLIEVYTKLSKLQDGIRFNQIYSPSFQKELLEKCLDSIHPEMEDTYTTTIFKLCLHLYTYSIDETVKADALTCTTMIKSFGIRQNKETHQLFCFNKYFQLLYSKLLNDDQKKQCLDELNEFANSESKYILILFLLFYFDTASNPTYNILRLPKEQITAKIVLNICKVITLLFDDTNIKIPKLSPNYPALTHETISQRFYNQIIYGDFGLQNNKLTLDQKNNILDCLIKCSTSKNPHSNQAKKALIKHISYIKKQIDHAEKENNLDSLIAIQSHLKYLETNCESISFDKLEKQYKKSLEDVHQLL
jgi:hypothetical protein